MCHGVSDGGPVVWARGGWCFAGPKGGAEAIPGGQMEIGLGLLTGLNAARGDRPWPNLSTFLKFSINVRV